MEELTIEQKAKRYDEILARAKGANIPYYKEDIMSKVKEFVDYLLPELVESEDERIRKAIINVFASHKDYENFYGASVEDILAWLENQDEQKPITDFSNLRTWKYIVDAVLTEKEGIGQYLDSPFTEEVAKKLQKRFGNIEQIPTEWSEEDEQLIDEVAVCLRKYEEKVQGGYSKFYVQSLADRIESLRPGNTCKATGWIEEDERMLNSTIWHLRYSVNNGNIGYSAGRLEDWLKSLKDRIK